jgi:outer membrane protein assembly factor BamB
MEAVEARELLSTDVLTYHNDLSRSGANTTETILNRSNVNSTSFGLKLSLPVMGQVYAQPLYVSNLKFPDKSIHNVVYVATEHDQVYAFDSDSGAQLWHFSVIKKGQTPIPATDTGSDDITPEIGITSTPVIYQNRGIIYFVANLKITANSQYITRLYALNIVTGAYKSHMPVNIQASSPGTGNGSNNGTIDFQPLIEGQRPAISLYNGVVYVAFASHGDMGPYHGWLLGFSATTLQLVSNWNATPDGGLGGIWESGGGVAVDSSGNLYVATGNGTFDADTGGDDYGDSVVKIPSSGGSFSPSDYFTPFNQATLEGLDQDFGSTGVLLLPTQGGAHPNELIVGGKEG